jgi:dTMP kinase
MSKLIVLEGLDGAGTTTQARRLADALAARGRVAHVTREPSDGPIGRLIREMLTGGHALPGDATFDQATFSLLFAADRVDHLQREVEPALAAGTVVVSDRWYHSSLAYQGTGAARAWIRTLNQRARRPDLTIFLRVRAEVAAERRVAAGRAQELFEDLAMQTRVAAGYDEVLAELAAEGEAIAVLDGERALDDVTAAIVAAALHIL